MRCIPAVALVLVGAVLAAGCGQDSTGQADLPKPMPESEVQKLGPKEQENVRLFQEMQRQNSGGTVR